MPQGTRPDWVAIRTEYESGVPRRELKAKYGVTESALNNHIDRGGWSKSRERVERKMREKREEKLAEKKADAAVATVQNVKDARIIQSELVLRRSKRFADKDDFTVLDLLRLIEATNSIGETIEGANQDTRDDQLILAIMNSKGKMHDADIPT